MRSCVLIPNVTSGLETRWGSGSGADRIVPIIGKDVIIMTMKRLLMSVMVCFIVLVPLALSGWAEPIAVRGVQAPDSAFVITGEIDFTPVSWNSVSQTSSFSGSFEMQSNGRGAIWDVIKKILK